MSKPVLENAKHGESPTLATIIAPIKATTTTPVDPPRKKREGVIGFLDRPPMMDWRYSPGVCLEGWFWF